MEFNIFLLVISSITRTVICDPANMKTTEQILKLARMLKLDTDLQLS